MIEVRQLRHFIAVAEEGGFRSAARKIHLSAPALTRSLNLLEDFYGVALLERSRTSVTPTALGKQFLRHARMVVNELDAIPDHLGKVAGFHVGRLRVGVSPVLMDCCVQPVVLRMQRENPGLKLSITIQPANSLLEALERRELDLVMCVSRPLETSGNLEIHPLYSEKAFWWVRTDHPLAGLDVAPIRAFLDYPFCSQKLPSGFGWMEDLAITVRRETGESIDTSASLECQDYGFLVRTTLETDSMALIPLHCAIADGRASLLKRLHFPASLPDFPSVLMSAAYHRSLPPPPAAGLMIDLVREELRNIDSQMDPALLSDLPPPTMA